MKTQRPESRATEILDILRRTYPHAQCALDFTSPYELLVATILSAQCTDVRVNQVTPELFRRCPTPATMAAMGQEELESLIRPTGFFRNKARSLRAGAAYLVRDFGGEVPERMEDLIKIPGVARKTANVVLGSAFGKCEGIVVDTHVGRLSQRLGLSKESDPVKVEQDLQSQFLRESWIFLGHALISHGRSVCKARNPLCDTCPLSSKCPKIGVLT